MSENSSSRKMLSLVLLAAGVVGMVVSLVMDFSGGGSPVRGPLLIIGAIAFLIGLYLFPTVEHHRSIINFIFLFPLLFTFAVTVIIPLLLGIFYSFTDWNGIKFTGFIGLTNYTTMFKDPAFIWSVLLTFLFVVFNMVLVNLVGFSLALLCTSKLKGVNFFRAAYFLPNLIGGIVLGYIWQFAFNNVLVQITAAISGHQNSVLANTKTAFMAIIVVRLYHADLCNRSDHCAEGCAGGFSD